MRNLILAAAAVAVGAQAFANDMTWKHAGEIRVRHQQDKNVTGKQDPKIENDTTVWKQRTHISLTGMKGEDLTGHVTMSNAQEWGRDLSSGDSADYISQSAAKNNINLLESYIWWKSSDMFSLRMGRGMFTVADGAVVSANSDEQIPTTFDGVLGTFDFGFMGLNLFGVKGAELGTGETLLAYDKESNFYGFSADFKNLPDMIKMANLHLIQEVRDHNTTTSNGQTRLRYGLTVGGDTMGFDYKVTYAGYNGTTRSNTLDKNNDIKQNASMFDLGAGYTFADVMNLRIGAVYHMDSGDNDDDAKTNNTYDGFHYDKNKYLPNTRIVSTLGNLTFWGLGVSLEPMDKTTVGLTYYDYSRSSDKAEVSNSVSHTAGTNKDKGLGSEVAFHVGHKYSDAFNIGAEYNMWTYGSYFKKANTTEVKRDGTSQIQLTATLKF